MAALRAWAPALCLNFHGGTRSMVLVTASGARFRAGFAHHKGAWIYNVRIPRAQEILGEERTVHTAEHLASAMFWLGCPRREIPRASLPIAPQAERGNYAVIHAAAASTYKTWASDGFLAVARHLQERWNLEPVFIGGAGDDFQAFSAHKVVAGAPLREVMRLIAGGKVFVGNDSGPAHIAAAAEVPLVVLYGRPEHSVIWAPWKAARSRSLASAGGIASISPEEVLSAIDELLGGS
jgi:ADP-heptose:LPS heptosyltransferase